MTEKGKWKKRSGKEAYVMTSEARNHWNWGRSSNETGQVLIIVAVAMLIFIVSLALATDVGYWRYVKRNMQKAADAGAIGGATENIYHHDDFNMVDQGAKKDTSLNGFTDNAKGVIITVNNPPLSGEYTTNKIGSKADDYVEVIIEQDQPTFFAKILNITSAKVSARAVAYGGLDDQTEALGCIYTLNPTDDPSFQVQGNNTIVDAPDCNIYVNSSSDNCALQIAGNSTVTSSGISVVGDACYDSGFPTPEPEEGAPPISDPLSKLTAPTGFPTSCPPERTNINIQDNTTLSPGVYCGGIRITKSGLTVNFSPGDYILYNGGFDMHSGGSTLLGTDVTFYNTGDGSNYGAITINANAGSDLSATNHLATEGCCPGFEQWKKSVPGILFWQDPNNTMQAKFNGSSNTILEGGFYFPGADVMFDGGNSTETNYAVIVAQNVKFAGNATFTITNDTSGGGGTGEGGGDVIPRVVLVE